MNNYTGSAIFGRLVHEYVKPHLRTLLGAMACMIVAATLTATQAWIIQPVLDNIFVEQDEEMLMLLPGAVFAIAIILSFANYGHNVLMRMVGQRIIARMQHQLFAHLLQSDLAMFHDRGAGHLISRFTNDINMLRASVSHVITGIAKEGLTMIFLIGVMFYQSSMLALIAFTVFPIAIYPVIRMGRRMRKLSDKTQVMLGDFTERLDETFQGVRMVRAYNREEYEITRAGRIIENLYQLYVKSTRVAALSSPLMETLGGAAIAAVIWWGGLQVLEGTTTPGAFFSFIAAMIMAYRPAKVITSFNAQLQEGLAAAKRLFEVLDTIPSITDKPSAKELVAPNASIEFDNVSFKYGEKAGGVSGISLTLEAGKTAALVGPSGGGKSTIMNLLLRFYDVGEGSIRINETDLRDATLQSLRRHFSLVSQETILFDDTVRANIAYGREGASEEEIIQAAKDAAADEFIQKLPEGYDTMIGPHGAKISGGQRQRLAIARALLKNAPILLLDEATSALDTESEQLVQQALERLMKGRTTLVIAHRLSTIRHADSIYVLKDGKIIESGTHSELIEKGGQYSRLNAHQFTENEPVVSA